jgi:hypothetical protein
LNGSWVACLESYVGWISLIDDWHERGDVVYSCS